MCNVLMFNVKMKKTYQNTYVEILPVESFALMIPVSEPPDPHMMLPKGHFVPGPGPSYDPQGSIV